MRLVDPRNFGRDRARIDDELHRFPRRPRGLFRQWLGQVEMVHDDVHGLARYRPRLIGARGVSA